MPPKISEENDKRKSTRNVNEKFFGSCFLMLYKCRVDLNYVYLN